MSFGINDPQVGQRVEISPHYDLWMMGARFGIIHSILWNGLIRVELDHPGVRGTQIFPAKDLKLVR